MLKSGLEKIIASRDWLYERLREICNKKDIFLAKTVTNFVFLRPRDAQAVFDGLKAAGILIRKMGDYLRITAGTPEENRELISAIEPLL